MRNSARHCFESRYGKKYWVQVPPPGLGASRFAFSIFKSGSTLLYNLLREICLVNEIPVIDLVSDAFEQGIRFHDIQPDIEKVFFPQGYLYLGFRTFFAFDLSFDLNSKRKVLLVRDPRDILVSLYFSQRYSHVLPAEGEAAKSFIRARQRAMEMDLESFVLENVDYVREPFERYMTLDWNKNFRLYRYEEIIFRKREWIQDLADYFDLSVSNELLRRLLEKYDILPEKENPQAHIRQVRPGNYKKHLRPTCIEEITASLTDILQQYGYTL
ncbi:MAG: hypothetical protein D6703_00950 [Zetaproteobacteria bacterium]|nr:MAG: hypothetical protein D6703_00950 [Zetaproteobacteria bacterium]